MADTAKVSESARNLAELYRQQADASRRLAHALELQAWQPDAFKGGCCRLAFVGPSGGVTRAELYLSDGERRTFPIAAVPRALIPAHVLNTAAVDKARFEAWRATGSTVSDVGEGHGRGRVYGGGAWIARHGDGAWYTLAGNEDTIGQLGECERWLWARHAKHEWTP